MKFLSISVEILVYTISGIVLGYVIDIYLSTKPLFTIIVFLISFYLIMKKIINYKND